MTADLVITIRFSIHDPKNPAERRLDSGRMMTVRQLDTRFGMKMGLQQIVAADADRFWDSVVMMGVFDEGGA